MAEAAAGAPRAAGAAGRKPPQMPALQSSGTGEGGINILAWAGYAEDGSTDPKVNWVTPFEQKTGCKAKVQVANTSDEMFEKMGTGDFDVVSASGDSSLRMIYAGKVAPVNTSTCSPTTPDIAPFQKMQVWNSVDGVAVRHPARLGRPAARLPHRHGQAGAGLVERRLRPRLAVQGQDHHVRLAGRRDRGRGRLPDGHQARPEDHQPVRARPDAVRRGGRPGQGAASRTSASFWAAYADAQKALENGSTVVGSTWQNIVNLAPADKAAVGSRAAEGGRDRLGRHLDDRRQVAAPQLRLHVDELDHQPGRSGAGRGVVR